MLASAPSILNERKTQVPHHAGGAPGGHRAPSNSTHCLRGPRPSPGCPKGSEVCESQRDIFTPAGDERREGGRPARKTRRLGVNKSEKRRQGNSRRLKLAKHTQVRFDSSRPPYKLIQIKKTKQPNKTKKYSCMALRNHRLALVPTRGADSSQERSTRRKKLNK